MFRRLRRYQLSPSEPPRLKPPKQWPTFEGPLPYLPRSRRDYYELLGNPGSVKVDRRWKRANIVWARIPGVNGFPCHRLVEPYLREAFRRGFLAAPDERIDRAWSFVFRHQRHDPARPLSIHSWGAAIDVNPKDNKARYFKRGDAPGLWSAEWRKIWPNGLSRYFVEAFCSVGFRWGGDWDGDGDTDDTRFVDPQHLEIRCSPAL